LSYGLRWQILPGFQEDGGNLANFDQRNNSIVVPNALAGYLTSQNITASNVAFQQSFNACNLNYICRTKLPCTKYVTASQDGLPQSLRNTLQGQLPAARVDRVPSLQRHQDGGARRASASTP
jgi:hypothetical protein